MCYDDSVQNKREVRDMKKIVSMNPDAERAYLKPDTRNMLLIIMGIKLVLSIVCTCFARLEGYNAFSTVLFYLVMFALMYDVCSFYQVCLQIAQSIFIGFLLLLFLLLGAIFFLNYALAFLGSFAPTTPAGEAISMLVMALVCLIPLYIDVYRLIRIWNKPVEKK